MQAKTITFFGFTMSRKRAGVMLACLLICAVILALVLARAGRKKQQQPMPDGKIAINLRLREDQLARLRQDSDADGLKDWEETLYRTDPQNPDTDRDGTPDGEEVNQNRDPAKSNTAKSPKKPNDYFATAEPLTDKNNKPLGTDKNLTADFTRTFLQGPLAQMLAGDQPDIDVKSVERYADQLKGRSVLADAPRFTLVDIRTNPVVAEEEIKQYFSSLQQIFTTLRNRGEDELEIMSQSLQSQDYGAVAILATYPDAYQKTIRDLRALPAPKTLADFHLSVLNYLSKFKRSVELFQTIETDPILTILAINERLKLNDEFKDYLVQSAAKIVNEFKK